MRLGHMSFYAPYHAKRGDNPLSAIAPLHHPPPPPPVRFTIYVKKLSLGKNPWTNKKALLTDRRRESQLDFSNVKQNMVKSGNGGQALQLHFSCLQQKGPRNKCYTTGI